MRLFFDTNVLASALTTRGLCAELFETALQMHEVLLSESVLRELERILPGKLGQSRSITKGFLALLRAETIIVPNTPATLPAIPDPDDEAIIAAALTCKAEYFVTGDKVLLKLKQVEHMAIVSPRRAWELLRVDA